MTRPKFNVGEGFWNTCENAGAVTTFRVLSPENGEPVDATALLTTLTSRIRRLDITLKEITSDASGPDSSPAEHEEDVREAADVVYKSLEVEVSLLDDPTAVPEDPSCDAAVDLWLPMHLAVVAQHEGAIRALLAFHQTHALPVLQQIVGTPLGVSEYVAAAASGAGGVVATTSPSLNATHNSNASTAVSAVGGAGGGGGGSVAGAGTGADEDVLASGEQTPCQKASGPQHELAATRSSASPDDARLAPADPRAGQGMQRRPVVELQVRPELGNTLVLLGHYVSTAASAAAIAPTTAATARTTKPVPSPKRRGSLGGTSVASHSASNPGEQHVDPTADVDDEAAEWLNLNLRQVQIETELFEDGGENLCAGNVLGMLKSLVRVAVAAVAAANDDSINKGPKSTSSTASTINVNELVDPEVLSHLYISASVLYDVCGGDLNCLDGVLEAFQGALTPVLRGKSLPYAVPTKSVVQQRNNLAASGVGALLDTPTMRPISRTSSGMLAQQMGTPRGRTSAGAAALAGPAVQLTLPAGVHASSTPFWLNGSPQEAQQLAFIGMWIAFREQYTERGGSARVHRHMGIRQDYRMAIAALKKARLPNLAHSRAAGISSTQASAMAVVVPSATSIVSSGQVLLLSRLLSSECRIEEFLDLTEDATLFNSLAPPAFLTGSGATPSTSPGATSSTGPTTTSSSSNNNSAVCGALPLVLAASAFVAAELHSPNQIRLVVNKMETMLSDTRTNTLRAYICGRPATHAERFEELWLSASQNSAPMKFKTRAEMLFYSAIEQVLLGAERCWAQEKAIFAANEAAQQQHGASAKADAVEDRLKRYNDRLTSMAKALQSWIALWRNFLINVRDRPVVAGAAHRRSVSTVSRTSATATPKMQPVNAPTSVPPPLEIVPGGVSSSSAALSPDPVAAVTAAVAAGANPASAPEEDESTEATETVQRLLDVLPQRLQHGEPPLPEIGMQICPPSAPVGDDMSTVTELPQTTLDSEFEYSQRAFGEMASSEPNDVKLKFYGLFKQATVGDINISKPWLVDQVGRAKWDAWNKLKGMNATDAKRMYVSEFKLLKHVRTSGASSTK